VNAWLERSQTAEQYRRQYERRTSDSGGSYSKFHGYAYDAVWTIALAVNSIVVDRGGRYKAEDFRGGDRLHAALNDTNFLGVTVSVASAGHPARSDVHCTLLINAADDGPLYGCRAMISQRLLTTHHCRFVRSPTFPPLRFHMSIKTYFSDCK